MRCSTVHSRCRLWTLSEGQSVEDDEKDDSNEGELDGA